MLQVLIVEDEKPISNLIRLSLTKEGYHCTCAFDGAAAADLLVDHHYDLILLDVMLPEIDGFELMEYIRPMKVPVIFLTAKSAVKDRVKGLKLGAEDQPHGTSGSIPPAKAPWSPQASPAPGECTDSPAPHTGTRSYTYQGTESPPALRW